MKFWDRSAPLPGPVAEAVERILWVALAVLLLVEITSGATAFLPACASFSAVSNLVGAFSTFIALIAFGIRQCGRIWEWEGKRWTWAMDGVEGAGLMLAVVALLMGWLNS